MGRFPARVCGKSDDPFSRFLRCYKPRHNGSGPRRRFNLPLTQRKNSFLKFSCKRIEIVTIYLKVSSVLNWLVRETSDFEANITALESIEEYIANKQEVKKFAKMELIV